MTFTVPRSPKKLSGNLRQGATGGAAPAIETGSIVMRTSAGVLIGAAAGATNVGVGVAYRPCDGSGAPVDYEVGTFLMDNSTSTDEIAAADIGSVCFAATVSRVAKTNGSSTLGPAGIVEDVTPEGVYVRFDEALTNAAL